MPSPSPVPRAALAPRKANKNRTVKVRLASEHCIAVAWWLRSAYLPFVLQRWRQPSCSEATDLRGQNIRLYLARDINSGADCMACFKKMGRRKIQGPDALRTLDRELASWFGALLDAAVLGQAPPLLPAHRVDGSCDTGFAHLGFEQTRTKLLGAVTGEAMQACAAAARGRRGSPLKLRTLQEVEALKSIGGDDEDRYRRRLRARAHIFDEWESGLRALAKRDPTQR